MYIMTTLRTGAAAAVAALFAGTVAAQASVTCESENYRDRECSVPGGPVALMRQLSTSPGDCIEGQTWGFNPGNNTIWVRNGCRAEFRVGYGRDMEERRHEQEERRHEHEERGMTVTCESENYRDQRCRVPDGRVALIRQLSTPPGDCIEGQTWGVNHNDNVIWVRNGCRAEFRVGYRD